MAGFFSKLFGKNQSPSKDQVMTAKESIKDLPKNPKPKQDWFDKYPHDKEEFLIREVKRSPYINHDYDDLITSHINDKENIFSHPECSKMFTTLALEAHDKREHILISIERNADTKFRLIQDVIRSSNLGLKEFNYGVAGDERDCDWCFENSGVKFRYTDDFIDTLEKNCTCQYNRSVLLAVVEW